MCSLYSNRRPAIPTSTRLLPDQNFTSTRKEWARGHTHAQKTPNTDRQKGKPAAYLSDRIAGKLPCFARAATLICPTGREQKMESKVKKQNKYLLFIFRVSGRRNTRKNSWWRINTLRGAGPLTHRTAQIFRNLLPPRGRATWTTLDQRG